MAFDGSLQQCNLFNGFPDGTNLVQGIAVINEAIAGDLAIGRRQAEHAAEALRGCDGASCRLPEGNVREIRFPRQARGASRASAAAPPPVEWVERDRKAKSDIDREAAEAELILGSLADDDAALPLYPLNDGGVEQGPISFEDAAARAALHPLHADGVLRRDHHPQKPLSPVFLEILFYLPGLADGGLFRDGREVAVFPVDALCLLHAFFSVFDNILLSAPDLIQNAHCRSIVTLLMASPARSRPATSMPSMTLPKTA